MPSHAHCSICASMVKITFVLVRCVSKSLAKIAFVKPLNKWHQRPEPDCEAPNLEEEFWAGVH
eukprot:1528923-Amphidinium_carterae.1